MKLFPFLFALFFLVGTSCSQTGSATPPQNSEITVSAEATVSAEPDVTEFHLRIISRQPLATEAFSHYLSTYEELSRSLARSIDTTLLKTGNLFITPSFNEKDNDQIKPIYYQVSALMTLSIPLSKLNDVLAQITSVEGVTINGIEFRAKDQDSLQTVSLQEAVKKAHEKAEAIAVLEHLGGLKVKTMSTSTSRPPVPYYGARMQTLEAVPSLNASDVTVSSSVTVTYTASAK
jgi:uncharacterized protein YggE